MLHDMDPQPADRCAILDAVRKAVGRLESRVRGVAGFEEGSLSGKLQSFPAFRDVESACDASIAAPNERLENRIAKESDVADILAMLEAKLGEATIPEVPKLSPENRRPKMTVTLPQIIKSEASEWKSLSAGALQRVRSLPDAALALQQVVDKLPASPHPRQHPAKALSALQPPAQHHAEALSALQPPRRHLAKARSALPPPAQHSAKMLSALPPPVPHPAKALPMAQPSVQQHVGAVPAASSEQLQAANNLAHAASSPQAQTPGVSPSMFAWIYPWVDDVAEVVVLVFVACLLVFTAAMLCPSCNSCMHATGLAGAGEARSPSGARRVALPGRLDPHHINAQTGAVLHHISANTGPLSHRTMSRRRSGLFGFRKGRGEAELGPARSEPTPHQDGGPVHPHTSVRRRP